MLSDPAHIRHATAADRSELADVLTRAFAGDPIVSWAFPDAGVRARRSPAFFEWSLDRLLQQDVSWTTWNHGGAALWALPDQWRETNREALQLVRRVATGVGRRGLTVVRGLSQVEKVHPRERHLYLAVLGVDPSVQGSGIGSALLQPGLQLCDDDRIPAYLETGNERNLAFYGRHGFEVTGRLELPKGPSVWSMWRDPQ